MNPHQFESLCNKVYDLCGINLKKGKEELVHSRLHKRLNALKMNSFEQYFNYLDHDKQGKEIIWMIDVVSQQVFIFLPRGNRLPIAIHIRKRAARLLRHALVYVCAFDGEHLIGFVKVIGDGGIHGFLLDTTVHPDFRRRGVGIGLVQAAVAASKARGVEWLHVDYEPHLDAFYRECGFTHTMAGLLRLTD